MQANENTVNSVGSVDSEMSTDSNFQFPNLPPDWYQFAKGVTPHLQNAQSHRSTASNLTLNSNSNSFSMKSNYGGFAALPSAWGCVNPNNGGAKSTSSVLSFPPLPKEWAQVNNNTVSSNGSLFSFNGSQQGSTVRSLSELSGGDWSEFNNASLQAMKNHIRPANMNGFPTLPSDWVKMQQGQPQGGSHMHLVNGGASNMHMMPPQGNSPQLFQQNQNNNIHNFQQHCSATPIAFSHQTQNASIPGFTQQNLPNFHHSNGDQDAMDFSHAKTNSPFNFGSNHTPESTQRSPGRVAPEQKRARVPKAGEDYPENDRLPDNRPQLQIMKGENDILNSKERRPLVDDALRNPSNPNSGNVSPANMNVHPNVARQISQNDDDESVAGYEAHGGKDSANSRWNSWSHEEEVFLVAAVMDRFFRRGSLASATKGSGNTDCWEDIKSFYDKVCSQWANLEENKDKPRLVPRSTSALCRHFKIMKVRASEGDMNGTKIGNFRKYLTEWDTVFNRDMRLIRD